MFRALSFISISFLVACASTQSWTKNIPPSTEQLDQPRASEICRHAGPYNHPTVIDTFWGHWQCTGSSSSAPPWGTHVAALFNNSMVRFDDYVTGSVGTGVWKWMREWKEDKVVEEWTNGSETHKRTFFQEFNATIVIREESGQTPGGPN